MLDLGCGYGYSTLAFALMVRKFETYHLQANEAMKIDSLQSDFLITGSDIHQDFIEKAIINQEIYK